MDISELILKTEADHTNRVPMDARLKTLLLRYALSAILATVLVSGAIITESYITSLGDTLNKFQTLKINSIEKGRRDYRKRQVHLPVICQGRGDGRHHPDRHRFC